MPRSLKKKRLLDISWIIQLRGVPVFDRVMFWSDELPPGPFTVAPANRLSAEEVGVPIFDY